MARNDIYDQSICLIERYAKCILKDKNNDSSDILNLLEEYVKFYCTAKEKYDLGEQVFNGVIGSINTSDEEVSKDEMLKQYQKEFANRLKKLKGGVKSERYKQFLQQIQRSEEVDEDIMTVSETLNVIDPISKKRIEDPVKNVKCGHSYEKSTILELIKTRKNTRCPIVGCSAKQYVREEDLVPDNALKVYLSSKEFHETSELESFDLT